MCNNALLDRESEFWEAQGMFTPYHWCWNFIYFYFLFIVFPQFARFQHSL